MSSTENYSSYSNEEDERTIDNQAWALGTPVNQTTSPGRPQRGCFRCGSLQHWINECDKANVQQRMTRSPVRSERSRPQRTSPRPYYFPKDKTNRRRKQTATNSGYNASPKKLTRRYPACPHCLRVKERTRTNHDADECGHKNRAKPEPQATGSNNKQTIGARTYAASRREEPPLDQHRVRNTTYPPPRSIEDCEREIASLKQEQMPPLQQVNQTNSSQPQYVMVAPINQATSTTQPQRGCFACGSPDHWVYNCDQRKDGNVKREAKTCFGCGSPDHWIHDCDKINIQPRTTRSPVKSEQNRSQRTPPRQNHSPKDRNDRRNRTATSSPGYNVDRNKLTRRYPACPHCLRVKKWTRTNHAADECAFKNQTKPEPQATGSNNTPLGGRNRPNARQSGNGRR
jgi:hypothetical protein